MSDARDKNRKMDRYLLRNVWSESRLIDQIIWRLDDS